MKSAGFPGGFCVLGEIESYLVRSCCASGASSHHQKTALITMTFSQQEQRHLKITHVMVMECTQHPTALLTLIVSGCMSNTN